MLFLPPATGLRQGNVFTSVCQELCPQWGGRAWQGVCVAGGMHGGGHAWQGACMAGETTIEVGGTHATGMHSCSLNILAKIDHRRLVVGGVDSLVPHNTHHSEELLPGSFVVTIGVVFLVEVIPRHKGIKGIPNHLNSN